MIVTLNSMFCINTHTHTHESQTLGLKVHTLYLTKRKKKNQHHELQQLMVAADGCTGPSIL